MSVLTQVITLELYMPGRRPLDAPRLGLAHGGIPNTHGWHFRS